MAEKTLEQLRDEMTERHLRDMEQSDLPQHREYAAMRLKLAEEKRLAELARNAARYEWLRERMYLDEQNWWWVLMNPIRVNGNKPDSIDSAIDAAMGEGQ